MSFEFPIMYRGDFVVRCMYETEKGSYSDMHISSAHDVTLLLYYPQFSPTFTLTIPIPKRFLLMNTRVIALSISVYLFTKILTISAVSLSPHMPFLRHLSFPHFVSSPLLPARHKTRRCGTTLVACWLDGLSRQIRQFVVL